MKNTLVKLSAFCLIVCFSFSSCATLFTRSAYPVSINSNPEGADLVILNKKGYEIYRGTTPATVVLPASSGYMSGARYDVNISYPGYTSQTVSIHSSLEGWYFGNILFGGLLGLLIIDPASGAMFKLHTDSIYVTFRKNTPMAEKAVEQPKGTLFNIVDIKDIPEDMRPYLVKTN